MPDWLIWFFKGFIPALIRAFLRVLAKKQASQDQGAADQRAADEAADEAIANEAKAKADEIRKESDAELDRRARRWRKP